VLAAGLSFVVALARFLLRAFALILLLLTVLPLLAALLPLLALLAALMLLVLLALMLLLLATLMLLVLLAFPRFICHDNSPYSCLVYGDNPWGADHRKLDVLKVVLVSM
jgi:hypothetical protein